MAKSSSLVYVGAFDEVAVHLGEGLGFAYVRRGEPLPASIDPSTVSPDDWQPSSKSAPAADITPEG